LSISWHNKTDQLRNFLMKLIMIKLINKTIIKDLFSSKILERKNYIYNHKIIVHSKISNLTLIKMINNAIFNNNNNNNNQISNKEKNHYKSNKINN
jgi:hypothetical protein